MSPVIQTIETALADVVREYGFSSIAAGYRTYSSATPFTCTVWWMVGNDCQCASGEGANLDEALADALGNAALRRAELSLADAA